CTDRAPAELLDRLTASSDGNPLFVRELVRMLIDDGVVRRDEDNQWTLAVDAAEMEVPPTIQSLLAARLDRLRPQERTVLERAGWLVAKTGGGADHDETVGFHLEQAQANLRSLGPLDEHGRALATDAATRLGSAARRALDRDDLLAAAGLAGRAVACLDPDDRARADVLLTRCEALLGAGDVAAAAPAIEELQRLGA